MVKDLFDIIKKEDAVVHVDLATRIPVSLSALASVAGGGIGMCACQAMTLATLPEALWPVQEAANKLASLRAKAVKARVLIPFPFIELVGVACRAPLRIGLVWHCICGKAEFLPSWSSDTVPVETQDKRAKGKDKLDIVRWCAAFQAYALAADAADVMCFSVLGAFACQLRVHVRSWPGLEILQRHRTHECVPRDSFQSSI